MFLKKRLGCLFVLLLPFFVQAEELEVSNVVAATEGDPSAIIAGCVHAVTGDCVLAGEDLIIRGAVPLVLRKTYVSGNGKSEDTGWTFFPHFLIEGRPVNKKKETLFYVTEPSGATLHYTTRRYESDWEVLAPIIDSRAIGMSNNSSGVLSGRTNLKNNRLFYYCGKHSSSMQAYVVTGDGLHRYYRRWRFNNSKQCDQLVLAKEELPNGCWIVYDTDNEGRPTFVKVVNPHETKTFAWASFHYFGPEDENRDCRIETSDGRVLEYCFEKRKAGKSSSHKHRFYLREVKGSLPFEQAYVPSSPSPDFYSLLQEVWHAATLQARLSYHDQGVKNPMNNRVKEIFQPDPMSGAMVSTYSLDYRIGKWKNDSDGYDRPGLTIARSADGLRQEVHWNSVMRPCEYKCYEADTLLSWHKLIWEKDHTEGAGNLKTRVLYAPDGRALRCKVFDYDEKFNVVKDTLYGCLSGYCTQMHLDREDQVHGGESYSHYYIYSSEGRNLILEDREDNGKVTRHQYLPGTSLPTAELIGTAHHILKRHFYQYDNDHLLIAEIIDNGSSFDLNRCDGVTYRSIKKIHRRPDGMPETIEEWYFDPASHQEKLLSCQCLHYSEHLLLVQESQHDADDMQVYSLFYRYDSIGRVMAKTDPIGRIEEFTYDDLGRCVEHRHFSGLKTNYVYDALGHLLQKQEIGKAGEKRTELYSYNSCGKLVAKTDYLGNTIHYDLDPLGRKRKTEYPNGSLEQFFYDPMGCLQKTIDRGGGETTTSCSSYGKPLSIQYPDGACEQYLYYCDGSLKEKVDHLGATHRLHYDDLGHVIHEEIFSPEGSFLKENRCRYDGDLLVEKIDAEGQLCRYQYDGSGRKIAEHKHGTTLTYTYDGLGRLRTKNCEDYSQEFSYDLLGQVTSERTLALDGRILQEERYVYDEQGNRSEEHRGDSVEHFFYDSFNRLVAKIDPTGRTTRFFYDESVPHSLRTTTIDASGTQTIETIGSMGEKKSVEVYSLAKELLVREEYDYDKAGRCIEQRAHLPRGVTTTKRTFDCAGNLLELIEAYGTEEQKITRHRYLPGKLLSQIHKNDGEVLSHEYDALGRMVLCLAKGGEGYRYCYDRLSRIIEVQDLTTGLVSKRSYHPSGQIEEEELMHGLCVRYTRDARGRPLELHLPDQTSVAYEWDTLYLKKIRRFNYEFVYEQRDLVGRPLVSLLPMNLGRETKVYDLAGRLEVLETPYHRHIVHERTPSGHISKVEHRLPFLKEVADMVYDPINQLKKEEGTLFSNKFNFDAHGILLNLNGQETKTSALYQVQKIGAKEYSYDAAARLRSDGARAYEYDAFDRLIAVEVAGHSRTEYAYDPWHRRMQKNCYTWQNKEWIHTTGRFFLYDGMVEIGSCDEKGDIIDVRIVDPTAKAELGATLAIEIHQKLYVPLHDLRGNITALVDTETRKIQEAYRYSAFGTLRVFNNKGKELPHSLVGNSWLFFGKRHDTESGLIYFGRRYYHAELGNWITPDPAGAIDRPNLYSFLRANPMTYFDAIGLSAEERAAALGLRHHWRTTPTAFSSGLITGFAAVARPLGYVLYYSTYHLPIPYVRDALVYTSAFLAQRPDLYTNHSKVINYSGQGGADPYPRLRAGHGNGIQNTPDDVMQVSAQLSQNLEGKSIDAWYSSSRGLFNDLLDAARLRLGYQTHATDVGYNMIMEHYEQMHAAFPDDKFLLAYLVHSRANLSMKIVLDRVQQERPEVLSHLRILGLGSPIVYGENLNMTLVNSDGDGIAALGLLGRNNVTLVPSQGAPFPFDHGILGKTYSEQIKIFCNELIYEMNGANL